MSISIFETVNSIEFLYKVKEATNEAIFKSESSAFIDNQSVLNFYNSGDVENFLNRKRAVSLEKDFTEKLLSLLREEYFEYGYENQCDILIKQQININAAVTREWLNKIFNANFDKPFILIGILRLISRFEHEFISPEGPCMAIAALSHKNLEVIECGIRAFENWESLSHLSILKNVSVDKKWLQDYLNQVIKNIELEYDVVSA